jgi:hypothetical protein
MPGVVSADICALRAIDDEVVARAAAVRGREGGSLARWTRGLQAPGEDAARRGQSLLTVAGALESVDCDTAGAAAALAVIP